MKHTILIFSILFLSTTLLFAQENSNPQKENGSNAAKGIEAPQVVEGDVIFSDGTNNLLRITDEGTTGAIQFQDGVPSDPDFKLYRNGNDLYFGTSILSGGGTMIDSLNDLADAKYDGSTSIFIGEGAGFFNTGTSKYNTGLGRSALGSDPPGNNNTAVGFYSLVSNTGSSNTAIGSYSLWNKSTGNDNVAIGQGSMYFSQEGSDNISIGSGSLKNNISGQTNTSIGTQSGYNSLGDGNVFLGYQAGFNEIGSNKLYIENSESVNPLIYGNFAEDSVKINGSLYVTENAAIGEGNVSTVNSLVIGKNNQASGIQSIVSGEDNFTFGFHTAAFGKGLKAMNYLTTVIGRYNVGDDFTPTQLDWLEEEPLLEIGNGTDDANRSNALTILKNGNVGIGPSAPTSSLHVDAVNGVLFDGATTGAIPAEGSGSRMMWYQGKSAFRAGNVSSNGEWDDINVGSYSSAFNYRTIASGTYSFASGYETEASGQRSTAMGSSTIASGLHSTALGSSVEASGNYSTAIGRNVNASGNGTIFIGDNSSASIQQASNDNRFAARFANGYRFFTTSDLSVGAKMDAGDNSWTITSDSTKKENFKLVDGEDVLNKISKFKLTSWNYKTQDPTQYRHYGPMAQDFYAAFGNDGIGTIGNDTTIASADFDGINLIAIQALEKRTVQQEDRIRNLEYRIKELEEQNNILAQINLEYRNQNRELKNLNKEIHEEIKTIKETIQLMPISKQKINIASN